MAKNKKDIRLVSIHPDNENVQSNLNIFNTLKKETALSVSDITEKSGIPGDVVAGYVNSCVKKDLLEVSGSDKGDQVKFKGNRSKILGIGFGDKECILTVIDLSGNIMAREQIGIGTISELKGKNKEINAIVETVTDATILRGTEFHSAGIAIPKGIEDKNPKGKEILAEGISRIFDCDTLIVKEATAAGYGERDFGEKTKGKDILYMHLDVGNGVIIRNEMMFEADGSGGPEEEAYLRPWDQFSVVSTAKSLVSKGVGTDIVNMVSGDIDSITLGVVLNAAEKGDELARDLVKRAGLALGVRVSYLVNMFNTELVILGGGTEKKEGGFIEFVQESSKRFLLKDFVDKVEIISGILAKEASSIGAALLCRRELFMEV
jgi:glucokinase